MLPKDNACYSINKEGKGDDDDGGGRKEAELDRREATLGTRLLAKE